MKIKIMLWLFAITILSFYSHAQTVTITTPDSSICVGETVTFTANIVGCTNSYYILWNNGPFVQDTCYQPCNTWTTTFFSGTHGIYAQLFCNLQGNPYSNQINMSVSPCAGVEELENASLTILYPNPAAETITIDLSSSGQSFYSLAVFDQTGKKININNKMNPASIVLSTSELSQGMYYYRLSDEKGKIFAVGKFVITK